MDRKRNTAALVATSAVLIAALATFRSYPVSGQYSDNFTQTYENNVLGLSFQYPSAWTYIPLSSGVAFVPPPLSTISGPRSAALFAVIVLDVDPNTNLLDFTNSLMNADSGTLVNFNLVVLPHPPAYTVLYTFNSPALGQTEVMMKFIRNGDKVYDVMYFAPLNYFKTYTSDSSTM